MYQNNFLYAKLQKIINRLSIFLFKCFPNVMVFLSPVKFYYRYYRKNTSCPHVSAQPILAFIASKHIGKSRVHRGLEMCHFCAIPRRYMNNLPNNLWYILIYGNKLKQICNNPMMYNIRLWIMFSLSYATGIDQLK